MSNGGHAVTPNSRTSPAVQFACCCGGLQEDVLDEVYKQSKARYERLHAWLVDAGRVVNPAADSARRVTMLEDDLSRGRAEAASLRTQLVEANMRTDHAEAAVKASEQRVAGAQGELTSLRTQLSVAVKHAETSEAAAGREIAALKAQLAQLVRC